MDDDDGLGRAEKRGRRAHMSMFESMGRGDQDTHGVAAIVLGPEGP